MAVGTQDHAPWLLLNASPDARQQLTACAALHPRAVRDTPLAAVLLTSGELDHTAGLLSLRESQPLAVWATPRVRDGFARAHPGFVAAAAHLVWRELPLDREIAVTGPDGAPSGIAVTAHAVPGKLPRHLAGELQPAVDDVVALRLRDVDGGAVAVYCPGAARVDDGVRAALTGADVILFDGTFWSSDELARAGAGMRRAEEMGHAPLGGPHGSLAALADLPARRRILTHLNNTNPLLREDAAERGEAGARGWEIARDGQEIIV